MARSDDDRKVDRLRQGSRISPNARLMGYETQEGREIVVQGDELAPWFRIVNDANDPVIVSIAGGTLQAQIEGDIAHDEPDSIANSFPVKIGGYARDQTPAAVADTDRVQQYFSLEGRGVVLHDLAFAGENYVYDYKRIVPGPLAVEQDSLLESTSLSASSIVVKGGAGRIYSAWAYNPTGADAFLQIRNGTAAGVPTHAVLKIPTLQSGSIDFGLWGKYHDTGIVVQLSSAAATFNAAIGQLSCMYF